MPVRAHKQIEPIPPKGDKITIRQRINAHTRNASCAACHRRIDPLGLAFDQYDAIGQWRTHEQVPNGIGEDPLVDASGTLHLPKSYHKSVAKLTPRQMGVLSAIYAQSELEEDAPDGDVS